jgi:hypothetical protein
METYQYQLKDGSLNFDQGVEILRKKFPNRVFVGYPEITYSQKEIENILSELIQKGISVSYLKANRGEYLSYLMKAEYKKRYPDYYDFNFHEKTFEHFIAHQLLNLKKEDNFIDIAAEGSPHAEIFNRITGCNGYMQDIMFEPGLHDNRIGSDVAEIPMNDMFFQGALAACSIEHFENDKDIQCIKELSRILDMGGRIVIVPLYVHKAPFCITDPRYSIPSNVNFDDNINIHCVKNWGNRHGRFYSPETLFRRIIKPYNNKMSFKAYYIENIKEVHESIYCRFALLGKRI